MQSKRHQESDALIDLRSHLTVAALAVAQLHRRHGDSADIDRLCSYAEHAITQIKEDIANIEAMLWQNESHHEPSPTLLRPHNTAKFDTQGQETGPMDFPSPAPNVDAHRQETRAKPLPLAAPRDPTS